METLKNRVFKNSAFIQAGQAIGQTGVAKINLGAFSDLGILAPGIRPDQLDEVGPLEKGEVFIGRRPGDAEFLREFLDVQFRAGPLSEEDDHIADVIILPKVAELEDLPLKIGAENFVEGPRLFRDARFEDDSRKSSIAEIFIVQERDGFEDGARYVPGIFGNTYRAVLKEEELSESQGKELENIFSAGQRFAEEILEIEARRARQEKLGLIMVDQIFDNRGQVTDELDLVKKNIGLLAEVQAEDLQGGLDPLVVGFLEVLPVERIFQVEQSLVSRFDLAEDQVEKRGFACSPHARDYDGLRGIMVWLDAIEEQPRFNHRLLFYI